MAQNPSIHETLANLAIRKSACTLSRQFCREYISGSCGLVGVKALESKLKSCRFKTHIGHGLHLTLGQVYLSNFASVYSDLCKYFQHCNEGHVSVQESQCNCTIIFLHYGVSIIFLHYGDKLYIWPYMPSRLSNTSSRAYDNTLDVINITKC